ncbi:MAG: N-6 DNA methylase [Kiritimatiellia bacterium]|jgi:type I restriction enzyme M protein
MARTRVDTDKQMFLELDVADAAGLPGGVESVASVFRKLYYHLYTNSPASRAERIAADLSLLLLLKLATETCGNSDALTRFAEGKGTSTELLIPLLRNCYLDLVDDNDRFCMGDDTLRECLTILRPVCLSTSPAHVLGEAFQALIGPRLRGDKGQFFTPRSLVRAMVRTLAPQPDESVLDPACGTSGFLIEAHTYQTRLSNSLLATGKLVGVDKDPDLYRISRALLQIVCGKRSSIHNLNSLDALTGSHPLASQQFDVILTNPPFGSRVGLKDKTVLCRYDFGHQWISDPRSSEKWLRTDVVSPTQAPQLLFLELCIRMLKPGGRMGIVLPEGVFGNKQSGYIWNWVRSQGRITALLDCPRTTFQPGTDTKTNVLFFQKANPVPEPSDRVYVAVPLQCGHDRRGRTHFSDGRPYPDDFANITKPGENSNGPWRLVRISDPEYLVPRYYLGGTRSAEEESLVSSAELVTLGDLKRRGCLSIRKGHECGSDVYGTGDIPFVRTSDIANFEISVDPTKAVSETVYEEFAPQQKLKPGDVLMVVDGRYRIGTTALLTESNYKCIVQSHFRIISLSPKAPLDPYSLMYALNLPSVKMRIRNLVFVQSTLGTLGNRLLELEIPLLHGDGPWKERVTGFREALRNRDDALVRLRRMVGAECEL